jgi:hypothetical protein
LEDLAIEFSIEAALDIDGELAILEVEEPGWANFLTSFFKVYILK